MTFLKQRGVTAKEHNCKVGNVTKVEVETDAFNDDENYSKPITTDNFKEVLYNICKPTTI